ncbi:MAG: sigma 54-interacting transcriptional regulator [Kofleriaceae bacterium]
MGRSPVNTMTQGEDTPPPSIVTHDYLFLVLECERPLAGSARCCLADLDEVVLGRADQRSIARTVEHGRRRLAIGIADRRVSSFHARLTNEYGRWILEDPGSKNGTMRNAARVKRVALDDGDVIEVGHTLFVFRTKLPAVLPLDVSIGEARAEVAGLMTLVPAFARELEALPRIAAAKLPVMIHGETGTGKELMARAVHALSGRGGAFVPVNCGAIPPNLVESELFGHKKGAFSGATEDRLGFVRSADKGTLFLDEIGDLPIGSQAALLRVLQEREVVPVGTSSHVPVDLRVVSATHHDLRALVERGSFRADLLARLAGTTVRLPPLRERREDLGALIPELLRRAAGGDAKTVTFSLELGRALLRHAWPLNIRELEHALAAAVVRAGSGKLDREHMPLETVASPASATSAVPPSAPSGGSADPLSPEDARRRDELVRLLREHHGNVSALARVLGTDRKQIRRWLKRYQLDTADFVEK